MVGTFSTLLISASVTWNPDTQFQKVKAVEGSSAIFAWNITFDNTNNWIVRVDIDRVNSGNLVLESIIYRLTSKPNVTVPESSYKHREKDLQLQVLYHTPSNTAKIIFTLHNVNFTADDEQRFKAKVTFSPKFISQSRYADLEVQGGCLIMLLYPKFTSLWYIGKLSFRIGVILKPWIGLYSRSDLWYFQYLSKCLTYILQVFRSQHILNYIQTRLNFVAEIRSKSTVLRIM